MLHSVLRKSARVTTPFSAVGGRSLKTAVLSFGDGSHGALGLPNSFLGGDDAYEPTRIPDLPPDISGIGAGHYHSLAVTASGELWAWGRNEEGQLGRGPSSSVPRDSWNQPKKVEGLEEVRVSAAFASGVISAAIGNDGSLWVWGKSKRGQLGLGKGVTESMVPSRVGALADEEIIKVSFGWGHALAQTRNGKLFGWGYSAEGRLGQISQTLGYSAEGRLGQISQTLVASNSSSSMSKTAGDSPSALEVAEKLVEEQMRKENNMPIIWEPYLLQELDGIEVADVSCGLDHSLALCCDGTLLSCGSNTYGQLGRTTEGSKMLPIDMNFQPLSISSGLGHSLAVCRIPSQEVAAEGAGVVSWGWNWNSQLGHQGHENIPAMVEGMDGEMPVSVSGGRVHSMVLTAQGELWAWGCGKNGRLGLGSSDDEAEPSLVESLSGQEILQAVSGFDHNLVLVSE